MMRTPKPTADDALEDCLNAHACVQVRSQLSDYVEGELDAATRVRIERSLKSCPQCQAELDALTATMRELHALRTPAPPSFLSDIRSQIHKRSKGRFFASRRLLFGRIPFEWLSFAMIVLMLLYYIFTSQSSPVGVDVEP